MAKRQKVEEGLAPDQQTAVDAVVSDRASVFITGAAGTGKTKVMKTCIHELRKRGLEVLVLAAYGNAAWQADGRTIASLFAPWPRTNGDRAIIKRSKNPKSNLHKVLAAADVIVVDEISTVDSAVFSLLHSAASAARHGGTFMGGAQFICVGDFRQFAPIASNGGNGTYAFRNPLFEHMRVIELTTQHRCHGASDAWMSCLQRLATGRLTADDYDLLRDMQSPAPAGAIHIYARRAEVASQNKASLSAALNAGASSHQYHAQDQGALAKSTGALDSVLPAILTLAIGSPVRVTVNHTIGKQYMPNGMIGTVTALDPEGPVVAFPSIGRIRVKRHMIKSGSASSGNCRRRQFPLVLAYAMTAHASLGVTLRQPYHVHLQRMTQPGQAYVSVTRASDTKLLSVSGIIDNRTFVASPDVDAFCSSFHKHTAQGWAGFSALAAFAGVPVPTKPAEPHDRNVLSAQLSCLYHAVSFRRCAWKQHYLRNGVPNIANLVANLHPVIQDGFLGDEAVAMRNAVSLAAVAMGCTIVKSQTLPCCQ